MLEAPANLAAVLAGDVTVVGGSKIPVTAQPCHVKRRNLRDGVIVSALRCALRATRLAVSQDPAEVLIRVRSTPSYRVPG